MRMKKAEEIRKGFEKCDFCRLIFHHVRLYKMYTMNPLFFSKLSINVQRFDMRQKY